MLLKFRPFNTSLVWKFQDPDTRFHYSADSRENLVRLIVQYRANNQLPPIERLDLVLENYLCRLPQNAGKCCARGKLQRGLYTFLKGGLVLVQNLLYDKTVDDEVANERAKQCVACPLNVFPDKGPFVKWADRIAEASVGPKTTAYNDKLGSCAACTCVLKAKVWYAGTLTLSKEEKGMMEAVNCWQLKIQK
jgi:hypothetical protein